MATIFRRPPETGNYYFRKEIHGVQIFQSLHTKSKTVARDRAKGIEAKARAKQFDAVAAVRTRNGSPTCEEIVKIYKVVAKARGNKHDTIRNNCAKFRAVVGVEGDWKQVRLHQLDRKTVKKYVDSKVPIDPTPEALGRWKRTIKSTLRQARSIFSDWALEEYEDRGHHIPDISGFMKSEGVSSKGVAKIYVRPHPDMEKMILDACAGLERSNFDLYTVFLLVYSLGLRAGEAAHAKVDWLHTRNGQWNMRIPVNALYSPKGARDRFLPVHPDVVLPLLKSAGRNRTGYFLAGDYPTTRYNLVTDDFSTWMHKLGWPRLKCAHELRALMGCRWYTEQGAEIAQLLLGHTSMQTTCQFYANYTRRPDPLAPNWK